jgi:Na+/H+ antiporter NhaD/arsenite permease-like protein
MGLLAGLGGKSPLAWWISVLTVGPLLGSFITEPAAMTICALLLARQFYGLGPSPRLAYATLGLLFVNVSVGGTLTHFAAPPVLIVAAKFGWDSSFMLAHFGWKAILGILVATGIYALFFRREFRALAAKARDRSAGDAVEASVPIPVTMVHLGFLAWTVFTAHTPVLFVGGFLFFLAFTHATAPHQSEMNLRAPLLVGFFLAGLVIHGSLQGWWIAPVLRRLTEIPLFFGAMGLTAFNDNAAITYLASLVPGFPEELKYAVVAGAVAGGGLTVIANAPNPAGQSILGRFFSDGVSALLLALGAIVPTMILAACFLLRR